MVNRLPGWLALALLACCAVPPLGAQSLPAFPGAQGGGAASVGGRGGAVCEVTNLNDSGLGSLRQCAESVSGPRTVVFRVGGTINLTTAIRIRNPFITIAGQTAPGGGILLSGKNSSDYGLVIYTHDVIVRYIRVRMGDNSSRPGGSQQGSNVWVGSGDTYNIILDHISMSWTTDETLTIWRPAGTPAPRSITLSWSINSESLASHATAFGIGCGTTAQCGEAMTDLDFHHNLVMSHSHRIPLFGIKSLRWINNITYNYGFYAMQTQGGTQVDAINNYWRPGPVNDPSRYEIQAYPAGYPVNAAGSPSFYVIGNMGPHNPTPSSDNWPLLSEITGENGSQIGPLSTSYRRSVPLPALTFPVVASAADELENSVLPTVGASQRLACDGTWIPNRDAVDQRLMNEYQTGGGQIPATEGAVGGFPTIAGGTPCTDTDHDGMPDLWESANSLNPNDASDGPRVAADGYTNLENYLSGVTAAPPRPPPAPPTGLSIITVN